jgi:hypothetical protein
MNTKNNPAIARLAAAGAKKSADILLFPSRQELISAQAISYPQLLQRPWIGR